MTRAGGVYEISLASVYVLANETEITSEEIWDERPSSGVCGRVATRFGPSWEDIWFLHPQGQGGWGHYAAGDSATALMEIGMLDALTETDSTSSVALDADGLHLVQNTAAAANAFAGIDNTLANPSRREMNPAAIIKFKMSPTTDIRLFAGLSNDTMFNMVAIDDPVADFVGLQYSSARGDSTWQFVSKDGTTLSILDSNVPVDTAVHYLVIFVDDAASEIMVYLLDNNFNVESARLFDSTDNLPRTGQGLTIVSAVESQAAAAKTIRQYKGDIVNRINL